jgi:hypothetical protein
MFRNTLLPGGDGVEVLEKRPVSGTGWAGRFEKRRTTINWLHYEWTVESPQAVYQFMCHTKRELTPGEVKVFEELVGSFRFAQERWASRTLQGDDARCHFAYEEQGQATFGFS